MLLTEQSRSTTRLEAKEFTHAPVRPEGSPAPAAPRRPLRVGTLYASPLPSADELQKLGPLDLLWNLTDEFDGELPMQDQHAHLVLCASILDYDIPRDLDAFVDQLTLVADSLRAGGKVLVHCFAGRGRTGMAVACLKVALEQLSAAEAVAFSRALVGGPETAAQQGFVADVAARLACLSP